MSKLVHIDPFLNDTDSFHANIGTFIFYCHALSSLSMATPTLYEIIDSLLPCFSQHFLGYDLGTF